LQLQTEPRVKKRLQCTLELDARRHSGLILNLSERGMFVQTSLPAEPGTVVGIDVRAPSQTDPIPVQAAVVWRRRVSPRMTGVNQSGMGLRLLTTPSEYQAMMANILEPVLKESSSAANATAHVEPEPDLDRYVLRLAQKGGPRSRRLVVESQSKQAACRAALDQVGEGWTILEIVKG
jgi:uncharacterized protein (TIGR02266 family)